MKRTATFFICSLLSLSVFCQNKSLHFDGTNDYLAIPENTAVLTGNQFTFEAWVKPTSFSSSNYIINKGTSTTSFCVYFNYMTFMPGMQPQIGYYINNGSGIQTLYTISLAWLNQWHHVAVSCNGTTISLLIDGVSVHSQAWSGSIPSNVGFLRIGSVYNGFSNFSGCIDEVRVWNVGRTQPQIQSFMNTEISAATPGLTAYYRMNEGTVNGDNAAISTTNDLAASPVNATLTNFAKTGATSNFTAGYASLATLPLKDASFTAIKKDEDVLLSWKSTASEFSTVFEIERSTDGVNFSKIGTVRANPGAIELDHSFTDQQPAGTINHYRVKSIGGNGQVMYSKTITVRMSKSGVNLQTYPNPVQNTLNLQVNAPRGLVNIQLKDLSGRTIQTLQLQSTGTTLYTSIDVSTLPKGSYVVLANNESTKFIKR